MNDYLNDLLVWAIILAVLIPIILAFTKRKRIFIIIFGVLVFLGAFPVAFMSELSLGGCCGAPSTGREGIGYVVGALIAIAGISIMVFSKKLAKQ